MRQKPGTKLKTSLRKGRPPFVAGQASQRSSINARRKSSKATRKLINTHHQLQKSKSAAIAAGQDEIIADIDKQIDALGGLEAYQSASLTGQDRERGGDSSVKLVGWLTSYQLLGDDRHPDARPLRVLEVGALSSTNAISRMIGKGVGWVERIDLHSQEPEHIREIDFMDLPIPDDEGDKFDVVSLSLVLNFVPTAAGRGKMLKRIAGFFRQPLASKHDDDGGRKLLPCLFLVLPSPCLNNSRYMDNDRLVAIMNSLGYAVIETHQSQKLVYMLFSYSRQQETNVHQFPKKELRAGKARNNFAVTFT